METEIQDILDEMDECEARKTYHDNLIHGPQVDRAWLTAFPEIELTVHEQISAFHPGYRRGPHRPRG